MKQVSAKVLMKVLLDHVVTFDYMRPKVDKRVPDVVLQAMVALMRKHLRATYTTLTGIDIL